MILSKQLLGFRFAFLVVVGLLSPRGDAASESNAVYLANCAGCHGSSLHGGLGPPLWGDAFKARWFSKGQGELHAYIAKTMPPANPGGLPVQVYREIADYLGAANNLPAAGRDAIEGGGVAEVVDNRDGQYRDALAKRAAILAALPKVSDSMLRDPPAEDWLTARRTDDGQGFSPLTQINSENVKSLELAWSMTLPTGSNEITPLALNGVLFLNSRGTVLAIDAISSDILWKFSRPTSVRQLGPPVTQPRGLAIFEDRLFVPTDDNHIIALDLHKGTVLWDHAVSGLSDFMRFSSSPIVVHGKVIEGASGCWSTGAGGKCFVVALDAKSGNEVWRVNTIPDAGEPGGDTWNGNPNKERSGASVWAPGTYDAESNLVYFGTGQTYHISALMQPTASRSRANAGLFTDSTLAINPDTGKLVWYYQHMARDVWDLDWAFERIVATLTVDSRPRRVVMTIGKIGILDVLDAKTGQYIFSYDLGLQNLVTKIDPVTGWKTTDPALDPEPGHPKFVCPLAIGVRNWPATSYDASRHLLYVGFSKSCMDLMWSPGEDFDISYNARPPHGDTSTDNGGVTAINVLSRKAEWSKKYRAPESSAALSTAAGLLFEGGRDRVFRASDGASGNVLWHVKLDNVPSSSPITFSADGIQFIVVITGGGNPNDAARAYMTPEIDPLPPTTTLWLFRTGGANAP